MRASSRTRRFWRRYRARSRKLGVSRAWPRGAARPGVHMHARESSVSRHGKQRKVVSLLGVLLTLLRGGLFNTTDWTEKTARVMVLLAMDFSHKPHSDIAQLLQYHNRSVGHEARFRNWAVPHTIKRFLLCTQRVVSHRKPSDPREVSALTSHIGS